MTKSKAKGDAGAVRSNCTSPSFSGVNLIVV